MRRCRIEPLKKGFLKIPPKNTILAYPHHENKMSSTTDLGNKRILLL